MDPGVLESRLRRRRLGRPHDRLDRHTPVDGVGRHSRPTGSGTTHPFQRALSENPPVRRFYDLLKILREPVTNVRASVITVMLCGHRGWSFTVVVRFNNLFFLLKRLWVISGYSYVPRSINEKKKKTD